MSQNYDLDLIFEAINGELLNLQTSTSTASPNSSAFIIDSFLKNLNTILNSYIEPTQVIEQLTKNEIKQNELIQKLKSEIKSLKDSANELNKKEKKQNGGDSELIRHLSAKVSKTLAVNTNLNTKLKVAQSEIESLKKLVITFRNGGGLPPSSTINGKSVKKQNSDSLSKIIDNNDIDSQLDNYLNSNFPCQIG